MATLVSDNEGSVVVVTSGKYSDVPVMMWFLGDFLSLLRVSFSLWFLPFPSYFLISLSFFLCLLSFPSTF
jgi:hypothetical protein